MRNDEIVIEVIFYFYDFGFFIYVWDEIVFEIEYVEVQFVEEGYEFDDIYVIVNLDLNVNVIFIVFIEFCGGNIQLVLEVDLQFLFNLEYYYLVQLLNFEQRCVFDYFLRWCYQ